MIIIKQKLEEVLLLKPKVFSDKRGYFFESFRNEIFQNNGYININFVQDNEVFSKYSGTIRGMHYQLQEPQGKLVHVVIGAINDVIVDVRLGSPTFGEHIMITLDSNSHNMVYIPEGFAHGYSVLKNNTIVQYKCTNYYNPNSEYGIKWNDEELNIMWNISKPIISERDNNLPYLKSQEYLPKYK